MLLSEIMLKTAECLTGLRYSTASANGTTQTLFDTTLNEPDGFFNDGTLFMLSGVNNNRTAKILDWDENNRYFTFIPFPDATVYGDRYAVLDSRYPRELLIAAINGALSELGYYPDIYEDATFITVADQEEYTLPTGIFNIKRVFIATSLDEPYNFVENFGWLEINGKLLFDMDTPGVDNLRIRLYYEKPHAEVMLDADTITDLVHPDLLAWTAAYRAALIKAGYAENSEPFTKEMLQFAQQKSLQMRKHPIKHWQKASRPSGW